MGGPLLVGGLGPWAPCPLNPALKQGRVNRCAGCTMGGDHPPPGGPRSNVNFFGGRWVHYSPREKSARPEKVPAIRV